MKDSGCRSQMTPSCKSPIVAKNIMLKRSALTFFNRCVSMSNSETGFSKYPLSCGQIFLRMFMTSNKMNNDKAGGHCLADLGDSGTPIFSLMDRFLFEY